MDRPDREVVEELLAATDAKRWDRWLELTTQDALTQTASGRLYIGREGFSRWLRDTTVSATARWFETATVRELGDGYVLVTGAEHVDPVRGIQEALPGAWIYHVRDGKVTAVIHYRTEREALAALGGPGRGELAANLVARYFDAFNRNDHIALVALVGDGFSFSTVTTAPGTVLVGVDQLASRVAGAHDIYDDIVVDLRDTEELEDGFCVAQGVVRTTAGDDVNETPVVWLARMVDDRLAEMLVHASVEEARLEAAARASAEPNPADG